MTPTPEVQERLRRYLLGQLADDAREEIEKELMASDELFEELLVVEDEIIDDYLGGRFDKAQRVAFESHFLATPERQEKLRFGRSFKRYLSSQASSNLIPKTSSSPAPWAWTRTVFSSPLRIAVVAIIAVGVALGIWRVFFYHWEVDRALLALNAAYREQRPIESRISDFNYAPYVTTRGPGDEKIDQNELALAELTLRAELKKNATPSVRHALGKVFLAKKEFDAAIEQFDEAVKGDPRNARLYSDLGAAWLEKGKVDRDGKDPGKGMEEFGRALEYLNKALELNPNLLEAHFNHALCRQYLMLSQQAAEDWEEYLKRDATSPWAEEARRNLKLLEDEKSKKAKTGEELIQNFRSAYAAHNEDTAWAALGPVRARTGSVIVQTLLDKHLDLAARGLSAEAQSELDALEYAGKVEAAKSKDRYTADLTIVYQRTNANQRTILIHARQLLKSGIERYNKAEWKDAIQLFSEARDLFSRSNDDPEALFAEAWTGYSQLRVPDPEKSAKIFERLTKSFDAKSYKSLFAQSLLAQADALGPNEFSEVLEQARKALAVSEEIQDLANSVRCLQAGTSMQLILGNYRDSLAASFRALTLASLLPPDAKLTWPFYHENALDFYFLDMPTVAQEFEIEALRLALADGLTYLATRSYDRLALIFEGHGKYDEALKNLEQARTTGQKILDKKARANIRAHSALNLGRLYRKTGNPQRAAESIDEALKLYQDSKLDTYQYSAHKEKFLALSALNQNDAAQIELETTLVWFEKYRKEIAEESYKNKFFDTGQNTYDLAIDFQISRRTDEWKAFDYAESARARSLLALTTSGGSPGGDATKPDLKVYANSSSLKLKEIQERLSPQVQLLEYAVLDDKVIIWLLTKDRRDYAQAEISRLELNENIRSYVKALRSRDASPTDKINLGKELYGKLIAPIEAKMNPALQLCIVPDDKLNFLPFGLLVSPASGRYLIEDYALESSPSATLFITNSERASAKANRQAERALVVGGPQFDRERFANLEDLPAARREAEEVASFYDAVPLLGFEAVTTRVQKELQNVDIAHFATHAVPDEESPLLSKLLLSTDRGGTYRTHHAVPSFLQASEIYEMRLPRMRLVVLSACQTGIERSYRGEGAIGLARPFMVAGAPLVIATLWPVESQASADFMISFHRHRKQDHVSTVEALHRAQLEALHNSQSGALGNNDWAAFIVIGGYANF
jgi:CHAT domain-containing protein/Flp pilus assembly protein TadD